jgi:hypothetical protein
MLRWIDSQQRQDRTLSGDKSRTEERPHSCFAVVFPVVLSISAGSSVRTVSNQELHELKL